MGEETSLNVDSTSLIGVYEFLRMNQVIIAYHVAARGDVVLSPELIDYRMVAPAQVKCWPAGTGKALADWLQHARHRTAMARPAAGQARHRGRHRIAGARFGMEAQKELDTRGLNCPLPILKAKKALADMASGDVLWVVATGQRRSVRDFQAFARQIGNELLEQTSANDEFVHFLRRR